MLYTDEIQEVDNDHVARYSNRVLRVELSRVRDVIIAHVMTGEDLSYWYERESTLERIIASRGHAPDAATQEAARRFRASQGYR